MNKSFREEYNTIKDGYIDFLREIKRIVEKLLAKNEIPIAFNISGRIKEIESIEEKHFSKRFLIKNSITELNDLVGLRIVLLFPEYKEKVIKLLTNEFNLLNDPSKNQQIPDKFGYSSIHIILGIKEEWLFTPDWKSHANKRIEIQIRTIAEHIWAETSHILFYKREENIPNLINRDLYRLAALLEVVDEKLQNIKLQVENHFKYIKECDYREILSMDLNPETFRRIMLKNSNDLYDYNDFQNKELSSRIEMDYNIINANILEDLISGNIELNFEDSNDFIRKVIQVLEKDKKTKAFDGSKEF